MNTAAGGVFPLVGADPRRWYIRIRSSSGIGTIGIGPLPLPAGQTSFATNSSDVEVHWKDAPSLCAGPWGCSVGGIARFDIWEVLYVGG